MTSERKKSDKSMCELCIYFFQQDDLRHIVPYFKKATYNIEVKVT